MNTQTLEDSKTKLLMFVLRIFSQDKTKQELQITKDKGNPYGFTVSFK